MGEELHSIDLTANQRKTVVDLLCRHLPNTTAWAYGSRVKFTSKPKSDLDLVVFANADQALQVAALKEAFDESDLPFRVDLFVWDEVPEKFRRNIEADRVVLAEREEVEVPNGWTEGVVGDVFALEPGYAFKSKEFIAEGIPVIKIKNIKSGYFSDHEFSYVSADFLEKRPCKIAKFDDLLISMSGNRHDGSPETWVGKVAPFRRSSPHLINQRVGALRVKDGSRFNARYAGFQLASWSNQELFISIATSSGGQANLSPRQILSAPIVIPPLPEQKAIAHVLGSLDDKIELNRQMNATLEGMAQALFKSWFVDFDPVIDNALAAGNPIPDELLPHAAAREALGDARKPLPEHIQNLFPASFIPTEELGWIPEGWQTGPLSRIGRLSTESVLPMTRPEKMWTHHSIPAFDEGIQPSKDLGSTIKSGKYRVYSDVVLASKLNPQFPRVWLVDVDDEESAICSTEFMPFRPRNSADRFFLYLFFKSDSAQQSILDRVTGSTGSRQRVKPKEISDLSIVIPPESIRGQFTQSISGHLNRVLLNRRSKADLAKTRDTLLPKLLSGDLRLPLEKLEGVI